MTTLEKIRQKCIEANPEGEYEIYACAGCNGVFSELRTVQCPECLERRNQKFDIKRMLRPIRLADVLLAMNEYSEFTDLTFVTQAGAFGKYVNMGGARGHKIKATAYLWNLRQDDLEKQTEETQEFIANVLGV